MEMVKKFRWIFLGIGVVVDTSLFMLFIDELADPVKNFGSTSFAIASLVQALSAWGWLLAILVLGTDY